MHEYEMVIATLATIGIIGVIGVFFASTIRARIKLHQRDVSSIKWAPRRHKYD